MYVAALVYYVLYNNNELLLFFPLPRFIIYLVCIFLARPLLMVLNATLAIDEAKRGKKNVR